MGKKKEKDATKEVAKTAGFAYGVKKLIGGITKLAIVAGISAAVVKIVRGRTNSAPAT